MTQSLELLLADDLDAEVRRQWAVLADAGLPSQSHHTGPSNRPHVTMSIASSVPAYGETAVKAALTGRLPLAVALGGLLCFPARGDRQVLARLVVPTVQLLELHATCAHLFEGWPGGDHPRMQVGGWTAHITLARLPTTQVGAALAALGPDITDAASVGTAVAARRWDSDARSEWRVA